MHPEIDTESATAQLTIVPPPSYLSLVSAADQPEHRARWLRLRLEHQRHARRLVRLARLERLVARLDAHAAASTGRQPRNRARRRRTGAARKPTATSSDSEPSSSSALDGAA